MSGRICIVPFAILLIVVGLFASENQVLAQICGINNPSALQAQCLRFVKKSGPMKKPTQGCCKEVKGVDVRCVCNRLSDNNIAQMVLSRISLQKTVSVARSCGKKLPSGKKCGSILVAVKKLAVGRFQHGVQQFHAEIKTLGNVRHPNLVTLIGYRASGNEMFLIYNYLPGGNLENFIKARTSRAVDWMILHKIALDVASALAYLHDQCAPRVLHRDVKPSNILLDDDFNAYLSDFGLSRLLGTSETHATTGVAGTFGYVAPEYALTCRVSDKADVYSYGVVLLELISDKKALDPSFSSHGDGFNIISWASMLLRQGQVKDVFNAELWASGPHDDLEDMLHLALRCTVETLSTRPTMKQVVQCLKQIQHSPN